jgi:hypothetical protein
MAGLALGGVLAVIASIRILVWPHHAQLYGPHYGLVAATVAFSLVGVVLFGSLSGSMLPFVLRKAGFDPAVCSAPFVATLVDVTGLVIYFTIASGILGSTLLAHPNPDVIKFGQERTTKAAARLLRLNDDWEVKEVDLIPKNNRINISIDPSEHLLSRKCPACGGHLSEHGTAQINRSSYLNWFDYQTEIDTRTPQLQCDVCGKALALPLPMKP